MAAFVDALTGLPPEQLAFVCGGSSAFLALFASFLAWHVYEVCSLCDGGL